MKLVLCTHNIYTQKKPGPNDNHYLLANNSATILKKKFVWIERHFPVGLKTLKKKKWILSATRRYSFLWWKTFFQVQNILHRVKVFTSLFLIFFIQSNLFFFFLPEFKDVYFLWHWKFSWLFYYLTYSLFLFYVKSFWEK